MISTRIKEIGRFGTVLVLVLALIGPSALNTIHLHGEEHSHEGVTHSHSCPDDAHFHEIFSMCTMCALHMLPCDFPEPALPITNAVFVPNTTPIQGEQDPVVPGRLSFQLRAPPG